MTITPTTLLGLPIITTGTESGAWGDDVNNGLTWYMDAAIAGAQTISGSQTAVTLSITSGNNTATNLAQAGAAGVTGSSQYQIINCTGNPASTLTITVPASSKTYIIINATSTSQSVKIVGAGPTAGVTVASGQRALVAWSGSDFVQVGASAGGSTTQVQYNNAGALAGSSTFTFNSGTNTVAISTLNLTNALGISYGGTGQTTASAAFNALSPVTTTGDLIIGNGTNSSTRLGIGTNGYILTSNGTTATWSAPAASGVTKAQAIAYSMTLGF